MHFYDCVHPIYVARISLYLLKEDKLVEQNEIVTKR